VVRQYTGHGIHNLFHCLPNIPHYAKNKAAGQMKEGMVSTPTIDKSKRVVESQFCPNKCFTIEPVSFSLEFIPVNQTHRIQMINLGKSYEVNHWPDNWTAVTVDGKRSAQFEETLLFVSNSCAPSNSFGVTSRFAAFSFCIVSPRTEWRYLLPRGHLHEMLNKRNNEASSS
jgi:methionyl aminopeptidase